ncbi:MAG: hypothetical protein OHK0053_37360 [Microscillaceae bacterium]
MRNRRIWISDRNFLARHGHKESIQGLLQKKILRPHAILGYEFYIREAFIEKVYALADSGEDELLHQLVAIWVEPSPDMTKET